MEETTPNASNRLAESRRIVRLHALGNIFVQHFESGGTFLSLDPEKVREHYAREVQKQPERSAPPPEPVPTDYGGIMP